MTHNLYRVYAPELPEYPRVTQCSSDSFNARKSFAASHNLHVTSVVAIRIREGDEVRVRDKRDNAIAITKAKLSKVNDNGFASIEVIEDDILADNSIGVPWACVEPFGEKYDGQQHRPE